MVKSIVVKNRERILGSYLVQNEINDLWITCAAVGTEWLSDSR